jgi:hypothetical protein
MGQPRPVGGFAVLYASAVTQKSCRGLLVGIGADRAVRHRVIRDTPSDAPPRRSRPGNFINVVQNMLYLF